MAIDLKWILSADDKASPVFDKLKQNATQATDGVSQALTTVGSSLTGLIAQYGSLVGLVAGGAAFGSFVSAANNWNLAVAGLAKTMGSTLEEASVFKQALETAGVEQEVALAAATRLARTLSTNEDAFRSLGVATRDQNGNYRATTEIMAEVNQALADNRTGTDRNVAANQVYGRSWGEVQALLKVTPELMGKSKTAAEELNRIVSQESVDASRKYKMEMNELHGIMDSMKEQIGNALLPTLLVLGKEFEHVGVGSAKALGESIKWTKENMDVMVVTMSALAAPRIAAGIAAVATSTGGLAGALASVNAALLANPAGLAALLAGGTYYATKQFDKGVYGLSGVDMSGMNRPMEEMRQAQAGLEAGTEKLNAKLKDLGFSSWKEFENAEKAGKVVFDTMSSTWKLKSDAGADSKAQIELLDKELAAFKMLQDSKTVVAKGQSDVRLSVLKSEYDQGMTTSQEFFQFEKNSLVEAAQIRVNNAVLYLNKESEVLSTVGKLQGETSKEYLGEMAKHTKAIEDVQSAQLAYGKTYVDSESKMALALKARTDEYTKINISALESSGQYAEAERLKQDLDQRSVEFLRLKKEALDGMSGAVQALADKEQAAALANITALQKEDAARRQYADDIRGLQGKIDSTNGVSGDVISARSAVQDALNQKKTIENKLQTARISGDLQEYSYATQMNALMDIRLTQLDRELALTLRKANLNALNDSDQIIVNDMIAKGLTQEAFWLQKKIDLRNEEAMVAADQLRFDLQIADALNNQNTELADSLLLAKQITAEQHQAAINAISDRRLTADAGTVGTVKVNGWGVRADGAGSGWGVNGDRAGNTLSPFGFPNMGPLARGTNYVPDDGYALLHRGEAVVPAAYNNTLNSGGNINLSGGINITVQGGDTSSRTIDDMARKLIPAIQKYQSRFVSRLMP